MVLQTLQLTHFRTYTKKSFSFGDVTIFVGPNTIGKTNILEAIQMLSTGKSFRAEKDIDTVKLGNDFGKIEALLSHHDSTTTLTLQMVSDTKGFRKRYLVNGIGKRLFDFSSHITTILFSPADIELVSESPSLRRKYIDHILFQAHPEYRYAHVQYEKALRQRNRLLSDIQEGKKAYTAEEFDYWNTLLLEHSHVITTYRTQYVQYLNATEKKIFDLRVTYDMSLFTTERIQHYHSAELGAGITLIGPQRDDFLILFQNNRMVKEFASRGEQRLAVLQLKLLEIDYLTKHASSQPILLLDDIYSELDTHNIELVTRFLPHQQTIITTTHTDYIPNDVLKNASVISLEA